MKRDFTEENKLQKNQEIIFNMISSYGNTS